MCTVSFIPQRTGFILGMNRDELLTRPLGLPPRLHRAAGRALLYPQEPGGGTWIGTNQTGLTLALINWYAQPKLTGAHLISRGEIIPGLLTLTHAQQINDGFSALPLKRINPFRLMAIFPPTQTLQEWRWDGRSLDRINFSWRRHHWFSSGYDEPTAERMRRQTTQRAARQVSVGTLPWLRRLHRSHVPESGPFAICMHRADAQTVSYTEIVFRRAQTRMTYCAGSPCDRSAKRFTKSLKQAST
jgi:hypothetical protein